MPSKDIRELLLTNAYQPSRHSHLLTPDQLDAYRVAGGGHAGRRAALAVMDGGDTEIELLREAWIAARLLLTDTDPEAIEAHGEARERYLEASGEGHVLGPPMGYGSAQHREWDRELRERRSAAAALPYRDAERPATARRASQDANESGASLPVEWGLTAEGTPRDARRDRDPGGR